MSQSIVLHRFTLYLIYNAEDYLEDLDLEAAHFPSKAQKILTERNAFIQRTQELINLLHPGIGQCFGFSVTHAAMKKLGKLDWWEAALVEMANWNGNREQLDQEVKLPNAVKHEPTINLRTLIERAINYVTTSHGTDKSYFPYVNQLVMLKPDGYVALKPKSKTDPTKTESTIHRSYFEMLDPESKESPVTIKSRQKIAGYLSKDQLIKDLNQIPEESMVFVSGNNHVIQISRKDGKWMLYDPNNDHTQLSTMHQILNQEECVDEIFNRLSNKITLEVVSFNENIIIHFPEYEKILESNPISLLKYQGLWRMGQDTPDVLLSLLKKAKTSPDEKKKFTVIIAESLLSQNISDWSTLHILSQHAQSALHEIISWIDSSVEGKTLLFAITTRLFDQTNDGQTAFFRMVSQAPKAFNELVKKIDQSPEGEELFRVITHTMTWKINDGLTGFYKMSSNTPDALLAMIKHIDNSVDSRSFLNAVTYSITQQINHGLPALHMMLANSPESILLLIRRIQFYRTEEGNRLLHVIAEQLPQKTNEGMTLLSRIILTDSEILLELLLQIDGTDTGNAIQNNLLLCLSDTKGSFSGLSDIADQHFLCEIIRSTIGGKDGVTHILKGLLSTWNLYCEKTRVEIVKILAKEMIKNPTIKNLTYSSIEKEILQAVHHQLKTEEINLSILENYLEHASPLMNLGVWNSISPDNNEEKHEGVVEYKFGNGFR